MPTLENKLPRVASSLVLSNMNARASRAPRENNRKIFDYFSNMKEVLVTFCKISYLPLEVSLNPSSCFGDYPEPIYRQIKIYCPYKYCVFVISRCILTYAFSINTFCYYKRKLKFYLFA